MQLTAAQTRRIQWITNALQRHYGASRISSGNMVFTLEVSEGGTAMFNFSNSEGLRWFDTHYYGYILISKQGGIHRYCGSASPKLVLPATPRLCEYINPHKKSK